MLLWFFYHEPCFIQYDWQDNHLFLNFFQSVFFEYVFITLFKGEILIRVEKNFVFIFCKILNWRNQDLRQNS
jgi:hypothetical protein